MDNVIQDCYDDVFHRLHDCSLRVWPGAPAGATTAGERDVLAGRSVQLSPKGFLIAHQILADGFQLAALGRSPVAHELCGPCAVGRLDREQRANDAAMPGRQIVALQQGQAVFYHSSVLHRGVYATQPVRLYSYLVSGATNVSCIKVSGSHKNDST